MHKGIVALLASIVFFAGCSSKQVEGPDQQRDSVQKISRAEAKKVMDEQKMAYMDTGSEKTFVVYGEGIAPQHTISPAQAMALAKRAAIADGYRQLGEKLYGAKINSTDTVKDAALKDSRIVSSVNGVVKDAAVTDATFKDGLYSVRMELTMSGRRWLEIFSY
ncbi:MAG: hypothetical protein PHN18_03070 [Sulfurospirillaceae bacterium]|nr:hypothetical protein [Sulfurospirillaceae bacterium]MDD2825612.1 hypothetical protein [Sulfurospirillaceae bacterium]